RKVRAGGEHQQEQHTDDGDGHKEGPHGPPCTIHAGAPPASAALPGYDAASARSSSMRSSWLYLATRSDRAGAPVLICPQLVATAMSAMVASSVSPERCERIAEYPLRIASCTASNVSVSVPIWLTFTRIELAVLVLMPLVK